MMSRTAATAWLLWPTDWFLAASLVRKGPGLVGKAGEWPYSVQKSKRKGQWALQGYGRGGKISLDEERVFIHDGELK